VDAEDVQLRAESEGSDDGNNSVPVELYQGTDHLDDGSNNEVAITDEGDDGVDDDGVDIDGDSEYENANENNGDDMEDIIVNQHKVAMVQEVLSASGLLDYLIKSMDRNSNDVKTLIMRVSSFICWVNAAAQQQNRSSAVTLSSHNVLDYFIEVIIDHYDLLYKYCIHLQEDKIFKASTIKNYLSDISVCAKWMLLYYSKNKVHNGSKISIGDGELFMQEIKNISRVQHKRDKKNRSKKNMAECIADRRQPQRGLSQLQQAVCSELPWARSLKANHALIDKQIYNKFRQLLYASLWIDSPQGRVGGIMSLKLHQRIDLLKKGFTHATNFKTSVIYGTQPVSLGTTSFTLFEIYLSLRRIICESYPLMAADDSPLWITFTGDADTEISRSVTAFFRRFNLHINPTAIRALVETTTDEKYRSGEISLRVKTAMANCNGHSSAVVKSNYLANNRAG